MLEIGQLAPDFEAKDKEGTTYKLSDFKGQNVILYFYPKDNTPGCTTQACDLRDTYHYFKAKGYTIIGISKDTAKSHEKFITKHNLPFLLLVDTDKTIIKAYDAEHKKVMFGKECAVTKRMTVVIDKEGKISHLLPKVKAKTHIEDLKKVLGLDD